jgi:hypothetical protein
MAAAGGTGRDEDKKRPINLWVSRGFHERLLASLEAPHGFKSMSSLIRYLIEFYNADEDQFDDLEQYQDAGSEVKINVWVGRAAYTEFRERLRRRGLTVTDAIKGLVSMYLAEAGRLLKKGQ